MPNPRLATRYAKSMIDLAQEKGQLETIYADMVYLQHICRSSRDFVAVLRSPVIRADKKQNIIEAITKDKVSTTTSIFTRLLVAKGRESDLPEIISAFVDQYNTIRGIHRVKLTTAVPVGEEVQKTIIEKTKNEAGLTNVELETAVNEKLIGGFVLEFSNNLVDASILSDLKALKKEFSSNVYIQKIR